jgi:hypothetical protein
MLFNSLRQTGITRFRRFSVQASGHPGGSYDKLKFSRVLKDCVQCAPELYEHSSGTPTFVINYSLTRPTDSKILKSFFLSELSVNLEKIRTTLKLKDETNSLILVESLLQNIEDLPAILPAKGGVMFGPKIYEPVLHFKSSASQDPNVPRHVAFVNTSVLHEEIDKSLRQRIAESLILIGGLTWNPILFWLGLKLVDKKKRSD